MNEFAQAFGHLGATVINNLTAHISTLGIGGGALFFVFVNCMPVSPPSSMQEYWTWVRDSLQTLTPARYHTNPSQPVAPAQPQK